jgi:hypothetical protein
MNSCNRQALSTFAVCSTGAGLWIPQAPLKPVERPRIPRGALGSPRRTRHDAVLGSFPATNPDFLWSFGGSPDFMRLSLKERRTRGPVQSSVQEIGAIDGCPCGYRG